MLSWVTGYIKSDLPNFRGVPTLSISSLVTSSRLEAVVRVYVCVYCLSTVVI